MEGWIAVLGPVVLAIIRLMTMWVRFAQVRRTIKTVLVSVPRSQRSVDVEVRERLGPSVRVRVGPRFETNED